ncbi:MAG: DUF3341 domain-containing protein [Acidobacteriaceae bacterium]|jgi:hypothetical protein|nr:DUF3341 domain-containing protein [Acidobacteriaceae bacterium]
MNGVYALYSDGSSAQRAVNGLRRAGIADDQIVVISPAPMDEFEFSHIGSKNHMWLIACLGAVAGFAFITFLAVFTSQSWPMNVGSMATVAWYPYLIPIFELTLLGAILATVVTLIVSSGLGRRRPALYDPAVNQGKILVGLENPPQDRMPDIERALIFDSAYHLKTV